MHKLSEILKARERLVELLDYLDHEHAFEMYAGHLNLFFSCTPIVQQPYQTLISSDIGEVKKALQEIKNKCSDAIAHLDLMRREIEQRYFEASEKLYQEYLLAVAMHPENTAFNNIIEVDEQGQNLISERLGLFTDWRLPGLLLRPGKDDFINKMVELDPLYLVDEDLTLLEPALARYNEIYQRRLRKYVVNDRYGSVFADLPQNQFGLIFAHSFFNVRTIQIFAKYLRAVFDLLRPGGVFAFTFCDGDTSRSVLMCESNFYCYTPGSVIEHHWKEIGFELQFKHRSSAAWTYVEIKKPGIIESNRSGQALAQIIPIQS